MVGLGRDCTFTKVTYVYICMSSEEKGKAQSHFPALLPQPLSTPRNKLF